MGHLPIQTDRTVLAIAAITIAVFCLSLSDALVKLSSANFNLWQIFVCRSLFALPLLALMLRHQRQAYTPQQPLWTGIRSALLALMWVFYYVALPHLDLSVAAASFYTLPLFICIFSALLLNERVGTLGWVAVLLGFLGVTLILRPAAEDFNAYALLPLLSAMLYALAMILTRSKCQREHPLMLSMGLNVAFLLTGGVFSLINQSVGHTMTPPTWAQGIFSLWGDMTLHSWLLMALLAVTIVIASVGAAIAYQSGPTSVVSIFDFSYVGFAVIWGIALFAEIPDTITLLGIGLIVLSGLLALLRKRR